MMKTISETAMPRIESLLAAAHRNFDALRERRNVLERSGIGRDHLSDDLTLMAFSLLGDHERNKQLEQIRAHWSELQFKGLAHGAINDAATAELRLLALALPHTQAIGNVWQRLQDTEQVPDPPYGILRCPTRVRGLWGQFVRLHFAVQDVRYMLIAPDTTFDSQPALVVVEPGGQSAGSFVIPINNGAINISLLHRSGEVFRHIVHAMVEEVA